MTVEEVFYDLFNKYGEDFNWYVIPSTKLKGFLVDELKN